MKTPKGTHPEAVALRKLAQMDERQLQEEATRLANIDGLSRGQRAHYRRLMQVARSLQVPIATMSEPEQIAIRHLQNLRAEQNAEAVAIDEDAFMDRFMNKKGPYDDAYWH